MSSGPNDNWEFRYLEALKDERDYWRMRAEAVESADRCALAFEEKYLKMIEDFEAKANDLHGYIGRLEHELKEIWLLMNKRLPKS